MTEERPDGDSTEISTTSALSSVELIGPYRLLQKIGEGGMGEVWLAEQTQPVHRRVALKLIKAGMDTKQVVARFEAERQALALMDHPAIAKVFDAGEASDHRPYFAMEYVHGVPITDHCDREKLTNNRRLELFLQVCEGVQHAHHKAVIHRDLKPSNVLVSVLDGKATVRIIDFGVAKAVSQRLTDRTLFTELGVMIGTPEYMSPEQADLTGQDVDTRTDVYSLGVMLYELLVGALPFESKELREAGLDALRKRIRDEDPVRPSVRLSTLGGRSSESARRRATDVRALRRELRGELDWITMRALEKDRGRRYGSPEELAQDIRRHLRDEPVLARPPSTAYRASKFIRRHRVGVAAATLVTLALTAGAIASTVAMVRARRAESRARLDALAKGQVVDFLKGLFKVSDPSEARGNSVTARELLDKSTGTIDAQLSGQPEIQADLLTVMGDVYRNLGLYDPALALCQKAVEIRRTALGPEHPDTLASMNALASTRISRGEHLEAEKLLSQIVEIQRRQNTADRLGALNNLAMAYYGQHRYKEAEPLFSEAIDIRTRVLGVEDPLTMKSMSNLAAVYQAEGRLPEAEQLGSRALELRRRVLGTDHADTLQSMNNLVNVYNSEGRYPEAERLMTETLGILKRVMGPEHPATLQGMNNLANVYLSENRLDESERLFSETVALENRVLGPRHPLTLLGMYNLASVAAKRGDVRNGLARLRETVDLGWSDADAMAQDPDMKALHGPQFDALLEGARRNSAGERAPGGSGH